jgi:hypothetical protein
MLITGVNSDGPIRITKRPTWELVGRQIPLEALHTPKGIVLEKV